MREERRKKIEGEKIRFEILKRAESVLIIKKK